MFDIGHVNKATMKRPNGYISVTTEEGVVVEHDSCQCVHCGVHTPWIPGSGNHRVFCKLCNGFTCCVETSPECGHHYPFEKKLDDYESGKLLVLK